MLTSNPSINIMVSRKTTETPNTSGHGSLSGEFRPNKYILAIPPVIASKHVLSVRANAPQAANSTNISIHNARNRQKKSIFCVARIYGICTFLIARLQ